MRTIINTYRSETANNKRRRRIGIVTALLLAAVMLFAMAVYVHADGGGSDNNLRQDHGLQGGAYEVTDYELNAVVSKEHTYDVEEKITVNIPSSLHQIEFAIPTGTFRMRGLVVEGVAFTSNISQSGSSVIIVDQQALSQGEHTYTIKYKILEFADRNTSRDIFYFNVLLPEWKQPIANFSATVSFPEDFPVGDVQYYAGQFGVQDTENRLTYEADEDAGTVTVTGRLIPENFGITLKEELPDGYWFGALDGVWAVFAMILVMGAAVLVMLVMWIIGGRDPRIKRVPQTRPIEGVSPVELGYVFNNRFDGRDLVRMIIYFAIRGYLRISEYEPKRYRLYRLNDPDGEEKLLRNAYGILFEDVYKGRSLDMDDIGGRLLRIENTIRDDVAAGFSSKDNQSFTPLSRAFRTVSTVLIGVAAAAANALKYSYQYVSINFVESILIGLVIAVLTALLCAAVDRRDSTSGDTGRTSVAVISAILAGVIIYFGFGLISATGHILAGVISAILCGAAVFLTVIMRARGKGNSVLIMRLRQLRRFISHPTPKEVLENYLADPGYYYDMMIYALTFGAEESWAISFLTLDVPDPDWYTDDIEGHAFSNLREKPTTVDYARDIRSFVRIVEGAYEDMLRRRHRL
jgi:hypothetical protein